MFELHDLFHNQIEVWIYWIIGFKSCCLFNQSFDKHFSRISRPITPNLRWDLLSVVYLVIDLDYTRLLNDIANLSPALRDEITLLQSDLLVVIVLALSIWRWLLLVRLTHLVRPQFVFFVLPYVNAAICTQVFIHRPIHVCNWSLLQQVILPCAEALKSENISWMGGSGSSFALKCIVVTWERRGNCLAVRLP